MLLKFRTVQMFAPYPIIPLMESNTVIINNSSGIDCPLEVFISLVTVQFELQGFHVDNNNTSC